MKRYSIYLRIEEWGNAELIEKQFKKAKKSFTAAIKELVSSKKITLAKTQDTLNAINISIDEKSLEEVLDALRKMEMVQTIDAEYKGEAK